MKKRVLCFLFFSTTIYSSDHQTAGSYPTDSGSQTVHTSLGDELPVQRTERLLTPKALAVRQALQKNRSMERENSFESYDDVGDGSSNCDGIAQEQAWDDADRKIDDLRRDNIENPAISNESVEQTAGENSKKKADNIERVSRAWRIFMRFYYTLFYNLNPQNWMWPQEILGRLVSYFP